MKVSKPTKKPPVTALGKIKIDSSLSDPRAYLKDSSEAMKAGHTKLDYDLDPRDNERNVERMKKFNEEETQKPNKD